MTAPAVKAARKSFPLALKATNDETGTFRALVSVFGVVDSYDEMIMPGAFAKSLERFGEDPIPILWNHQWGEMDAHLASAKGIETDEGLEIEAQFDMDDPASQKAYRLLKSGRIKEFSIGGFEPSGGVRHTEIDGRDVWEIHEFELVEVSLVLRGANPETRLIDVKSAAELVAATSDPPAPDDSPPPADPDSGDADPAPETSGAFALAQQKAAALLTLTNLARGAEKGA